MQRLRFLSAAIARKRVSSLDVTLARLCSPPRITGDHKWIYGAVQMFGHPLQTLMHSYFIVKLNSKFFSFALVDRNPEACKLALKYLCRLCGFDVVHTCFRGNTDLNFP